jgi:hypothetical protein
MKEMIGEDAVNRALRKLITKYAYAPPPYPTSYALLDGLREQTPPNLQYLIKDLFEDITLFSNRTLSATARKRADGQYDVSIVVEARKFKADGKGNETEVPVDDWIDIGAFTKAPSTRKYGDTLYSQRRWSEVLVLYLKRPRAKSWELRRCGGALQIQRLEGSRPGGLWDLYLDEPLLMVCEFAVGVRGLGFQ